MMEARKWEELQTDCLVNILGRVEMESLVLDIPFVCKSWYKACLNPLSWKKLDFSFLDGYYGYESFTSRFQRQYRVGKFSRIKLVKGVVRRSAGCATHVELPSWYGVEEFSHIADNCPALKTLVLYSTELSMMLTLSSVIGRFKDLEMLGIRTSGLVFKDVVYQIGTHCHNFTTLNLVSERYNNSSIGEDEVMAVVNCLPKLKALTLNWVRIERENLIKLLNGCVGLLHLYVGDCYGFDGNDEELLKLASHIPTFNSSGSVVCSYEDEDEEYDYCFYAYDPSSDSDDGWFCDFL